MAEFLENCDYRKVHEFALYLGVSIVLMTLFCIVLLRLGKRLQGFPKNLAGSLAYLVLIAVFVFELYLVDEKFLLASICANSRVDVTSFLAWGVSIVLGFFINYFFFGARLRSMGFYTK